MPIDISVKVGIVENIHIGVTYSLEEIQLYTNLFKEFFNMFAWSHEEIPSIKNIYTLLTREKSRLLKEKLKNFSRQGSFTLSH